MKKYNYQEFKNDPRTYSPTKILPRATQAVFNCIDNKKISPEELFKEIDRLYSEGKHRSPHYIKHVKIQAIKLLNQLEF